MSEWECCVCCLWSCFEKKKWEFGLHDMFPVQTSFEAIEWDPLPTHHTHAQRPPLGEEVLATAGFLKQVRNGEHTRVHTHTHDDERKSFQCAVSIQSQLSEPMLEASVCAVCVFVAGCARSFEIR